MARRKSLGSFGPKRKSYGSGNVKLNTKGYRATSASFGPKGARVNVSKRGVRMSSRRSGCLPVLFLLLLLAGAMSIVQRFRH